MTYLVDRIAGGAHPPDSAPPIEPVLCEEFGVSRTIVREAVKVLAEKGLVRAAPGRGTRVRAPQEWNLLDPVVLEAEMAADAAGRITDLELA